MSKKKTTEEFIEEAQKVHRNKYNYSKVEYINNKAKVCIICPIHGEFWQCAVSHLRGRGCPLCGYKLHNVLCNVGINDIDNACNEPYYKYWSRMIKRCYYINRLSQRNTYSSCSVCEEWLLLSNFKKWFDKHYVEGWELDKDILVKGNKIYSPNTCCFVPQDVNKLFTRHECLRGDLPIGVSKTNSITNPYRAYFSDGGFRTLGVYKTFQDAFNAYKIAKERRIKEIADKYKQQLELRVYEALCNYKVEIND